jgi:uncharacterized protein YoxC
MNKKLYVLTLLLLISSGFLVSGWIDSQQEETESNVPELMEFHSIIYPIWHDAFPDKDFEALRSYVSEINSLAEDVYTASLPGILRDKQAKWEEGLKEFKQAVDDYNSATAGDNNEALLQAAEDLHAKYEMMVRIIRPVLKEMDEFHKVLYVIYHKYLPEKEFDKIKSVTEDLLVKAEAITQAELPKRLADKNEEFTHAAQELYESVKDLNSTISSEDEEAINSAVEHMHTQYQNLEAIFD